MQVVSSKQKLVLDAASLPPDVLQFIPHAKEFTHKGKRLIAMDHGVDEIAVLKNLGHRDVPHPIRHYYHWPARFPAMDHQKDTAAFLASQRKALCLNAPGTGKTMSCLWASDFMLAQGLIKKVLIIAPLSTVKVVWGKEITHHLPHREFRLLVGSKQKRKNMLADPGVEYFIINHDGFSTMPESFFDFDLVIYDEATALKSPTSQRFKKFATFMRVVDPRLWLLTGTPISQNPTDAWTLAKLVDSKTVPRSFAHFREMTMRKVTQFRWVPREEANDICKKVLQPSIRFSLDECKDLPQTSYVRRDCELTPQQEQAYEEMRTEAMVCGTDISASNAAVLFGKLLQIGCGVAYDSEGEAVQFDDSGRLDALEEIINEIGGKVIVFVPLRAVQDRVVKWLKDKKFDVASVHGGVSKAERNNIFDTFQNSATIQILVAHPKVAAHGLTLTRSKSIIWYAPIHSLEQYEQANARIRRLSTEGKTVIYHIAATGFERELYRRLKQKQRVLTDFLTLVKGINE